VTTKRAGGRNCYNTTGIIWRLVRREDAQRKVGSGCEENSRGWEELQGRDGGFGRPFHADGVFLGRRHGVDMTSQYMQPMKNKDERGDHVDAEKADMGGMYAE
jgi:hypothetical protein